MQVPVPEQPLVVVEPPVPVPTTKPPPPVLWPVLLPVPVGLELLPPMEPGGGPPEPLVPLQATKPAPIAKLRTVNKEWMHFGTFIDITGHFFDTVHFPDSVKNYPFRGDGIYLVLGKIVEEFGFPSMEVRKMAKMPLKKDPRV